MSEPLLTVKDESPSSDGTQLYRRASRLLEAEQGDELAAQGAAEANPIAENQHQSEAQTSSSGSSSAEPPPSSSSSVPASSQNGTETTEKAINLLVRAVRAGSTQARELLEDALTKGRGIGHKNIVEVLSTIRNQTTEPVVMAAREVFTALATPGLKSAAERSDINYANMSADQLERVLQEKFAKTSADKQAAGADDDDVAGAATAEDQREAIRSIIEKTVELGDDNKKMVSEDEFLAVAVSYANGELPGGNLQALRESSEFNKLGWLERAQLDPLKTAKNVAKHALHFAEDKGERWLIKAIPYHQLAYILFLYIMTYVVVPKVMWHFVPLFLFYASLAFMIIATFQQIWFQRIFQFYHVYSYVFSGFNSALDVNKYELMFTRKNGLHSLVLFFSAYVVIVAIRPLATEMGLLNELVTLLAFFFSAVSFLSCAGSHFGEIYRSMKLRLAAVGFGWLCSSGLLEGTPLSSFLGAWFSIPLAYTGVSVTVGPQTALLAASTGLLVRTGLRRGLISWPLVVLPHLVFLAWLDLALLILPTCSLAGFLKVGLAVLALPFSPVLITLAPIYLASRGGLVAIGLILTAMLIVAGSLVVLARMLDLSKSLSWFSKLQVGSQLLLLAGFILGVTMSIALVHSSFSSVINPMASSTVLPIGWKDYADRCNKANSSVATRQLACLHFNGQLIQWRGTVQDLRITEINNNIRSTLTSIPWGLGYYFYWLGFPDSSRCPHEDEDGLDCKIHHVAMSHLDLVNVYKFSLTVQMPEPDDSLTISVGHHLLPNVPYITEGTQLEFKAVIHNAGSDKGPTLTAKKVSVLDEDGREVHVSQIPQEQRSVADEMERAGQEVMAALAGAVSQVDKLDLSDRSRTNEP
eukprot:scpid32160/ scgid1699/ Wolframin